MKSIIRKLLDRDTNASNSGPGKDNAKSFMEKQESENAIDRRVLGLREVPVEKIVGSVGRYHGFESQFRLKKDHEPQKLKLTKAAMREKKPLPPADFDIIAKIVLERDLLSSESDVVRQFVQGKVRRIARVTWTQTMITLSSKIKTSKDFR